MTTTLAIDPGHDGGACLLDPSGRRALLSWAWRRLDRIDETVYRLLRPEGEASVSTVELATLHDVGTRIRRDVVRLGLPPYHLVVERLFVPSQEAGEGLPQYLGRLSRVLQLGEATGQTYGPLLGGLCRLDRPYASQWRAEVLDLPPTASSDLSEERAVAVLAGDRPLVVGLGALATDPHAAEAACMAVWGHRQRHPRQQGLFGGAS